MKKVMLGGVALITLGFVGAAVAADMPVKAPAPVVVNTWTGFYVGVNFGGGGLQKLYPVLHSNGRSRPSTRSGSSSIPVNGSLGRHGAPRVASMPATTGS